MQFFDELPTRGVRKEPIDWARAKADLVKTPGKWGLVAENVSSSTPGQLLAGKNRHFRGDDLNHFEFRVSKPLDPKKKYRPHRTDLYGRYTPPAEEATK